VRHAGDLAAGAGTVRLTAPTYGSVQQRLAKGVTGTMFKTPLDARQGIDILLSQ
jgi:hypothetical protein